MVLGALAAAAWRALAAAASRGPVRQRVRFAAATRAGGVGRRRALQECSVAGARGGDLAGTASQGGPRMLPVGSESGLGA